MTYKTDITQDFLKSILDYNPDTGVFIWKTRPLEMFHSGKHSASHNCNKWNARYSGVKAASFDEKGYISIGIYGKNYRAHILAWIYIHNENPIMDIDHIDGDKSNNSIKNLRLATRSQNQFNRKALSVNKSGYKGVYFDSFGNRYRAKICCDGRTIYLGSFDTAEEAYEKYCNAAKELHGEFARFS